MAPKENDEKLKEVIVALQELSEDSSVPKNVKSRISEITELLRNSDEVSIRINKALNVLDELSDDNNIQAYSRTQIWNIVSMLETMQC